MVSSDLCEMCSELLINQCKAMIFFPFSFLFAVKEGNSIQFKVNLCKYM